MREVTVGQAGNVAGVPFEVLRELCNAWKVPARKGERGHWYLRPEDIPAREWIVEALHAQYREDLAGAQEAMVRFMREVEAVQLDLNEAAEDTTGPWDARQGPADRSAPSTALSSWRGTA